MDLAITACYKYNPATNFAPFISMYFLLTNCHYTVYLLYRNIIIHSI